MRRLLALVLCLLFLTACGNKQPDPDDMTQPVRFYYCALGIDGYGGVDGALSWELRDLGSETISMDELVKLYLQGPQNNGLYAPFPADTTIRHMKLDNGVLYLELSADLTGMERTLSAACLVSTMTQFEAVDAVNLTCSGVSNQGVLGQNLTMGEFCRWMIRQPVIKPR